MPRQSSRIANCAADGTPYPSDFLKNRKKTWWHFPKLYFSFMHERISINDAKSISGTGKGSPNWTGNINGTVIKLANGDLYDGEWNITEPLQADWKKGQKTCIKCLQKGYMKVIVQKRWKTLAGMNLKLLLVT